MTMNYPLMLQHPSEAAAVERMRRLGQHRASSCMFDIWRGRHTVKVRSGWCRARSARIAVASEAHAVAGASSTIAPTLLGQAGLLYLERTALCISMSSADSWEGKCP